MTHPLFPLGQTVATPGAIALLQQHNISPDNLLQRHVSGDWGDIDPADRGLNEQSLCDGSRLLSSYDVAPGERVWIITEADRTLTTILLAEEY